MKKKAITYYHDFTRGYSHIEIHDSGVAATNHFKAKAQQFFNMPIRWKKQNLKLTTKNRLSAHIGMRGYYARFLTEEESAIYEKYGEDSWFNFKKGNLCEPKIEIPDEVFEHV